MHDGKHNDYSLDISVNSSNYINSAQFHFPSGEKCDNGLKNYKLNVIFNFLSIPSKSWFTISNHSISENKCEYKVYVNIFKDKDSVYKEHYVGLNFFKKNMILSSFVLICLSFYLMLLSSTFSNTTTAILTGIALAIINFIIFYCMTNISLENINYVWAILIVPFIIGIIFGIIRNYFEFWDYYKMVVSNILFGLAFGVFINDIFIKYITQGWTEFMYPMTIFVFIVVALTLPIFISFHEIYRLFCNCFFGAFILIKYISTSVNGYYNVFILYELYSKHEYLQLENCYSKLDTIFNVVWVVISIEFTYIQYKYSDYFIKLKKLITL